MFIDRVSAITPIGVTAVQTAWVARAASYEPQTTSLRDRRGQRVGMCRVGGLGADLTGYPRMMALAERALRPLVPTFGAEPIPMAVAVPEAGRPDDEERFATFGPDLARQSGLSLDPSRSAVVRADRAGVAHAIEKAGEWLESGARQVLVGGVDSYHHPEVLLQLDEERRLHTYWAHDGFVPGEAAAFFVVSRDAAPAAPRVLHVATGDDPAARREPDDGAPPDIARTMTAMIQSIGARWEAPRWIISDHNGERHRVQWWQLVAYREAVARDADHLRLPAATGDLGAATGAVAVAVAQASWETRAVADPRCLVALHGEDGQRGVIYLERAAS